MTPTSLLIMGLCLLLVGFALLFFLTRKSYKNTVEIARQTGADPSDVIWIKDQFRVVNKGGAWVIEFAKLKEKTRSIDGKLWTKYLKPSSHKKFLAYSREEWDAHDMSAHIKRGLKLYESTEGEFYPLRIKKEHDNFLFSILDQDNRQFVINEIRDINDLTRNKKQEVVLLWGIIVGFLVLAITFIVFMYFMNRQYESNLLNMAKVCQSYAYEVVNQTTTGPTYIGQLAQRLGG